MRGIPKKMHRDENDYSMYLYGLKGGGKGK